MNIRNLEQNSRILLDLSQSKENCDLLIKSNNGYVIIKIIYDEWHELYEYCLAHKQKSKSNLTFFLFENRLTLVNLLNRRMITRRLGQQSLNNLILNEYETDHSLDYKLNLNDIIFKIIKFNETLFESIINGIKLNSTKLIPNQNDVFNLCKLELIHFVVNELNKQASVGIQRRLACIKIGACQAICELIELVWLICDENDKQLINSITDLTLNSTKFVNSLLSTANTNELIILDVNSQLCQRRHWLNALYKCLYNQFNLEPNVTIINTIAILIKNLTTRLNDNFDFFNQKLDDNSLALISFNEIKFAALLTRLLFIKSIDLKSILNALLSLSLISFENKKDICNVMGSLELFIELLKPDKQIHNKQIEEISISLLRSLAAYLSVSEEMRSKLRDLNFYSILVNNSLCCSNLNVVANATNILWCMSARSKQDQDLMISLGNIYILILIIYYKKRAVTTELGY